MGAVKDRLKFFFSDANIRQDYFMRKSLMSSKPDSSKTVTVESLLKFNTIKSHTTKPEVVVKAAKELSDILTVDDDGKAIGRVTPFTKNLMGAHIPKSLHLKNLPTKKKDDDSFQYAVSVGDLRGIFEKYGEVALIKLKWGNAETDGEGGSDDKGKAKKVPTGCAIVEFESEADLEKAAKATLTSKAGEELTPSEKIALGDDKTEVEVTLLAEMKKQGSSPSKKRKESEDDAEDEEAVKTFTFEWQPGCVIRIKGVPESCDREALLDMVAEGMSISVEAVKDKKIYVDYSRGAKDGALRFPVHGEHIAAICTSLAEGKLKIQDTTVEGAQILEGDEEKKYWDEFIAFKNRQIQQRADEKRAKKKHKRSH